MIRLVILLSVLLVLGQVFAQEKSLSGKSRWKLNLDPNAYVSEDCVECKKNQFGQTPPVIDLYNLGNLEEITRELSREEKRQFSISDYEKREKKKEINKKKKCYRDSLKFKCPESEIKFKLNKVKFKKAF